MLDIGGLILLIGSLAGAIKGRGLPIWIPQAFALVALGLLIYQGVWRRSRFALIHTAALWVALTWIAGHVLQAAWGKGILVQFSVGLMLLVTPLVVLTHQRARQRFSPGAGKKLELTRTETTPFRDWLLSRKKATVDKRPEIPTIGFDLGEEIHFQNK